jgi:signal transduction histidine kinase
MMKSRDDAPPPAAGESLPDGRRGSPAGERGEIRAQREFVDRLSRIPAMKNGDVEAVAPLITEACSRLLAVERVGVWLFDETETELRCIDQFNLSTAAHSSGARIREHEFRGEFEALKDALYVDASDPYADPRTVGYVEGYLRPNRISSMLDVVIRFGGDNLGTLCFEHVDRRHTWQQHEIDFGCMVCAQLSVLLERRALQRTEESRREIERRLAAAQELDALKSRFLANVSHELRTPLTLVLGPLEDLLAGAGEPPTEWQREQLEAARRCALRLLEHVDALLYFVRVGASGVNAVYEPTDVVDFTRQLVGQFASVAARAGLRLRVDCRPLSEPAFVDRDMWEKIVCNLVSNALKYTHVGEVTVTLRQVERSFELEVRDTGIGIPAEALPHLFERFYRVPDARGRTAEGAGIGLALAKELVELHGGTIHVESEPGCGSSFRVELPLGHAHLPSERVSFAAQDVAVPRGACAVEKSLGWLAGAASPESAVPEPPPTCGARPRVLVADDNAEMRAYLVRLLADRYAVETVADGVDALAVARARPPDLVLSDIMMPRLDGMGLLRALRSEPSLSTVPVVLVSARSDEVTTVEALGLQADDYLSKPFSARELLARVAAHIELARARREAAESALKDTFLGVVGHELRTPLTSLKLRVQAAQRKLAESSDVRAAEHHLAAVDRSLARLERLVEEILSMNAIASGRLALVRESVDLAAICREVATEESAAFARSVALDLPRGPVEASVDRRRVREVVKHLLANALMFSPGGRPVTVSLRNSGAEVVLRVRDEGPGISPEEVAHIFDRFYRTPGTTVQVGSQIGLGLGLYIARAIVGLHGGRVEVESAPGHGSTFVVTLPRAPASPAIASST